MPLALAPQIFFAPQQQGTKAGKGHSHPSLTQLSLSPSPNLMGKGSGRAGLSQEAGNIAAGMSPVDPVRQPTVGVCHTFEDARSCPVQDTCTLTLRL